MKKIIIIFLCLVNLVLAEVNSDFQNAIKENNYANVVSLIKKGAKANAIQNFGDKKPIFYAVDTSEIQNLDEEDIKEYIEIKIKIIELLISKGANVNEIHNDGGRYTEDERLFDGVSNPKIAEYIAKKGVKFNSLIEATVAKKDSAKTKELLAKSSKESKEAAFSIAVKFGYIELAKLFLEDKAVDINNALITSVNNNQYEMTEFLLSEKANPNIEVNIDKGIFSARVLTRPLDIALRNDNRLMFDLLLKYGAEY